MPVTPVKSTGGYQLIDMKGLALAGTVDITDKDIADAFAFAFEGKKPVYIHNYSNDYFKGPLLLTYNNDDSALVASLFASGLLICELSFVYNSLYHKVNFAEYIPE